MAKVCLLLMVKNEEEIIDRCLASFLPHVDEAVICDTGSTDDTLKRAEALLKVWGKPYTIHRDKWVNFGHNRTLAMQHAAGKCDYTLFADADIELLVHDPEWKAGLGVDGEDLYLVKWEGQLNYRNPKLSRSSLQWEYRGPTHEYLAYVGGLEEGANPERKLIDSISFKEHYDGSSRKEKYERDIELLKKEIMENPESPDTARWLFYLAQSHWDLKQWEDAKALYLKRASIAGWAEEVYYSLFRAGHCALEMGNKWEATNHLLRAHAIRPNRLEAIFTLCFMLYKDGNPHAAYLLGDEVAYADAPAEDVLFIHRDIYDWRFKDLMSICAWSLGFKEEGLKYLAAMKNVPDTDKQRIERNKMWFVDGRKMEPVAAKSILLDFKEVLESNGVSWWLHAGTLLGAVREGDFLKHDADLDIGVESKTMTNQVVKDLLNKGFRVTKVWGRRNNGFELCFERDGITCDMFFFYNGGRIHGGKKWASCYHDWSKDGPLKIDTVFEPFEVGEIEFLGETFPCPENPESFLAQLAIIEEFINGVICTIPPTSPTKLFVELIGHGAKVSYNSVFFHLEVIRIRGIIGPSIDFAAINELQVEAEFWFKVLNPKPHC